jgi:hypothetical protein
VKPENDIVIYESGEARVEVRLDQDTVWLTQEQMSALFGRERSVITKHIRNVFADGELKRQAVCAHFARTAPDSKTCRLNITIWARRDSPRTPWWRWLCSSPKATVRRRS